MRKFYACENFSKYFSFYCQPFIALFLMIWRKQNYEVMKWNLLIKYFENCILKKLKCLKLAYFYWIPKFKNPNNFSRLHFRRCYHNDHLKNKLFEKYSIEPNVEINKYFKSILDKENWSLINRELRGKFSFSRK